MYFSLKKVKLLGAQLKVILIKKKKDNLAINRLKKF